VDRIRCHFVLILPLPLPRFFTWSSQGSCVLDIGFFMGFAETLTLCRGRSTLRRLASSTLLFYTVISTQVRVDAQLRREGLACNNQKFRSWQPKISILATKYFGCDSEIFWLWQPNVLAVANKCLAVATKYVFAATTKFGWVYINNILGCFNQTLISVHVKDLSGSEEDWVWSTLRILIPEFQRLHFLLLRISRWFPKQTDNASCCNSSSSSRLFLLS